MNTLLPVKSRRSSVGEIWKRNEQLLVAFYFTSIKPLQEDSAGYQLACDNDINDESAMDLDEPVQMLETSSTAVDTATRVALNHFRLFSNLSIIDEDLGYWVKPRSTTWFSKFLLQEYDDARWVQMFRMSKRQFFLTHLLAPIVRKKDTKYRLAVPILVRIACTLFKLSHGASLLICNELFAVGRSTVSIMLREVVHAVITILRNEISWPRGDWLASISMNFEDICGLPGVVGAIDGTHIAIKKPRIGASDYFYFKSGGYSMNCQAVVDSDKRFLDLYIGMPGSTNNSRMLRRSTLYYRAQRNNLWDPQQTFFGFSPYLVEDGGYLLLPWLMVPHRDHGRQAIANRLFNRKLSKGRVVVEDAFGQLKMTFCELLVKTDLDVTFVPDVITCCALLHNVLLRQSHEDVEWLLDVLNSEGHQLLRSHDGNSVDDWDESLVNDMDMELGRSKRHDLGIYLSLQR